MAVDFSVVIPTFRRPRALEEALDSVLTQESVTVEVHVLDDDSDGWGREVAEGFQDARIHYHLRAVPSGGNPSLVRNEGWRQTRGRFVHFLDDDDRVLRGVYREVRAAFGSWPGSGVVFGRVQPFGEDPEVVARERARFAVSARRARRFQALRAPLGLVASQLSSFPPMLVNSACFIRREGLESVGGYDESLRMMEDVDFWLRAIRRLSFTFLDQPVVEYRTDAPSFMHDPERNPVSTREALARIHAAYAGTYGRGELLALNMLGKTLLRWL